MTPSSLAPAPPEAAICQTLKELRGQLTILAISHQTALVEVSDRVFRILDGNITLVDDEPEKSQAGGSR